MKVAPPRSALLQLLQWNGKRSHASHLLDGSQVDQSLRRERSATATIHGPSHLQRAQCTIAPRPQTLATTLVKVRSTPTSVKVTPVSTFPALWSHIALIKISTNNSTTPMLAHARRTQP